MRAALAALLLVAAPAAADGPALAHLTIDGVTLTLTADAAAGDGPMVFAQRHLGFALPPILEIALAPGAPWTLDALRLEGHGIHDLFVPAQGARITAGAADGVVLIAVTGYRRGPNWPEYPSAVEIEVHLRSP